MVKDEFSHAGDKMLNGKNNYSIVVSSALLDLGFEKKCSAKLCVSILVWRHL